MTALLTAAGSPPISFHDDGSDYRAGACNIGPAEIASRRRAGHLALIGTVVLFVVLVAIGAPPLARFIVALPAAVAVACYMEAYLKFCIGFGWLGVFNFGARGSTHQIADSRARSADRWRSFRLSMVLLVICLAIGAIAVVLPV